MSIESEDFVEEINELLDDARYKFAWETLVGIKGTVELTKNVTENQRRAVTNIRESANRSGHGKEWKRRYEGYGR